MKNISIAYGETTLFSRFNLDMKKGDTAVINAKSGKGKSTLLKMILGFENSYTGTITVDGISLTAATVRAIRSKIAYVSQDAALPPVSVHTFLTEIFSYAANRHLTYDKERFVHYAALFSLPDSIDDMNIARLSGGERQRISIITALLLDRPLLLLDEPTSALDEAMKKTVLNRIISLDKTVLIVSHDVLWRQPFAVKEIHL